MLLQIRWSLEFCTHAFFFSHVTIIFCNKSITFVATFLEGLCEEPRICRCYYLNKST
jgi:hypothetical protein